MGWGGWGWGAYLGYLKHCTVLAVTRYVAKSVFQDAEWGHPVCCSAGDPASRIQQMSLLLLGFGGLVKGCSMLSMLGDSWQWRHSRDTVAIQSRYSRDTVAI